MKDLSVTQLWTSNTAIQDLTRHTTCVDRLDIRSISGTTLGDEPVLQGSNQTYRVC